MLFTCNCYSPSLLLLHHAAWWQVLGIKLSWYRNIHGFCMCLAYAMLFGAGVMFSRRSDDLASCIDMYAPDDSVFAGAVFYNKDGALHIGGENFTVPMD